MRHLRRGLDVGLPILGVVIILSAVLFVRDIRAQIAIVMVGIVFIEAGVWKLAHQLLPNERHFHALRDEVDAFIDLSRELNSAALAIKGNDTPATRDAFEDIRESMHQAVDQISEVAGKTADELVAEPRNAMTPMQG